MKRFLLALLLLFVLVPQHVHADGPNYFQFDIPEGTHYSPGWFGYMTHCPQNVTVVMYNDRDHYGIAYTDNPVDNLPITQQTQAEATTTVSNLTTTTNFNGHRIRYTPGPNDGVWQGDDIANKWLPEATDNGTHVLSPYDGSVIQEHEDGLFDSYQVLTDSQGRKCVTLNGDDIINNLYAQNNPSGPVELKPPVFKDATKNPILWIETWLKSLFSTAFFVPTPAYATDNARYFVTGQVFVVNGTDTVAEAGRIATAGNSTLTIVDTGAPHQFTLYMANGTSGTVTSGTSAITGSPVTLTAGLNTITATGTGTATLNLTLGTGASWVGPAAPGGVNSWSAAPGGQCGASVPTNTDSSNFDANSFTAINQICTVDATANCLNMDWTGATNTPTLAMGNNVINIYGDVTYIAAMVESANLPSQLHFYGATSKLTTNGLYLHTSIYVDFSTSLTLQDNLSMLRDIVCVASLTNLTFDTNNKTVNCRSFQLNGGTGAGVKTVTLGSSVITFTDTATEWSITGNGCVLTANTATLNLVGSGNFVGGGITTYNTINLNGTAHTISGSNTFAALNLPAATTQTITFTAGTRQTVTTATLSGNATHAHTLKSGTAGTLASIWATNKTDAYVTYTDMLRNYNGVIVANCTGAGGGTFAGAGGSYTSLTQEGAGNYALTITGNNTFTTYTVDRSVAAKTITGTAGSVQTVNNFVCALAGTTMLTLNSTGAAWTLAKATAGKEILDYLTIPASSVLVTPAVSTWYYGRNSSIGAGNTGWNYGAPSSGGNSMMQELIAEGVL